ncbi:hypothetical protein MHI57_18110 [Cytobacillus sp. FSL K6-0129]|uniref:hypothetical protein n=1 Tax=unclassified Cytobacillus TaxID=2675268 RepID=UPI0030FAABF5
METKSVEQQLFDAVFMASMNLGYKTVDYLPPSDFAYPFVFIGETFNQDGRTKSGLYHDIQQRIHVYHTIKKRRELSTMVDAIKRECRLLKRADTYYINCKRAQSQILPDNTDVEPLLHAIIELEFRLN